MGDKTKRALTLGAEVVGGGIGTVVGSFGGIPGAVAGASVGVALSKGLTESVERFYATKDMERFGAVAIYACNEIEKRLNDNNYALRNDGFFDNTCNRDKATELMDGVFTKARIQYEEKKIRYLANIYVNTAFISRISPDDANQILSLVDNLTYRKMCVLSIQAAREQHQLYAGDLRTIDVDVTTLSTGLTFALHEYLELFKLGLIEHEDDTTLLDISDVDLSSMKLSKIGQVCYDLLGLYDIPVEDCQQLLTTLSELKRIET